MGIRCKTLLSFMALLLLMNLAGVEAATHLSNAGFTPQTLISISFPSQDYAISTTTQATVTVSGPGAGGVMVTVAGPGTISSAHISMSMGSSALVTVTVPAAPGDATYSASIDGTSIQDSDTLNITSGQHAPPATEYDPGDPITVTYSAPDPTNPIGVSAGETINLNLSAVDKDKKRAVGAVNWTPFTGSGPYQIILSITGEAEFDTAGSGVQQKPPIASLVSGNVFVIVKNTWNGAANISVKAIFRDNAAAVANGNLKDPDVVINWTLTKRNGPAPLSMVQTDPAPPNNVWRATPAVWTYLMKPLAPPAYKFQSVLETFGNVTASGFTLADLTAAFKAAHPTWNTANLVAQNMYNSGNNGTFVIDAANKIKDQDSGFGDTTLFLPASLTAGVSYTLPQTFSCGGITIGQDNILSQAIGTNPAPVVKANRTTP